VDDREIQRQADRLRKEAKLREAEITLQLKELVAQPRGRMFMWWLLEIGKVGMQPFTQEPHLTSFACGELNVGQQILARLLTDAPEGYLNMLQERNDAARRSTDQPDGRSDDGDTSGEDSGGAGGEFVWGEPDSGG
jgi:hypothetical protein